MSHCSSLSTYLDRAKKKVKSLKNKPPKSGNLLIADSFDQAHTCPLFRGLTLQ